MEAFQKLKDELISKSYLDENDIEALKKFSILLNRVIVDYNYRLDWRDYFLLGAKYYFLRDYLTSLIYVNKLIEFAPDFARGYNLKALILEKLKRYNQALEFVDKAIELNPNIAWDNKALILMEIGFYNQALECANKALEINPNNKYAIMYKSQILIKLGKYNEALNLLDKFSHIDYFPALHEKAYCLLELNKLEEAISIYDEILNNNPNDARAYYNRACAYSLKNEKDKAISDLKMAIELNINYKFLAMDDRDFDNIRDSEEFKKLIEL